jgi:hypothetical protein
MVDDIFASPAVPLFLSLAEQGFTVSLSAEGRLQVAPGSRLSAEQRRQLVAQKDALLVLVRVSDPDVLLRRDVFRRRLDAAERTMLPALQYRADVPYAAGVCFSCGDSNGRSGYGRCWRCSLAWRLAARVPVPANIALVLDVAKQVA